VSATATLAVVLLAFFVVGIGAGVAVVTALSVRRTRKPRWPGDWPAREDDPAEDGPRWPAAEDDDEGGYWSRGGQ
jgi:hypothetical protein